MKRRIGATSVARRCLLAALPVLAACGERLAGGDASEALPTPRQVVVAMDLSGSRSEVHRAGARAALDRVIDGLGYGDRIVFIQVHQRSADEGEAVRWSETVPAPAEGRRPTSLDRERLDAVKQAARSVAGSIFGGEGAGALPTTDLFATLHVAGEYVRDAGRRPTDLVLLSDMLQSAHGVEMSRPGGVPAEAWIRQQADSGLLPALADVCVTVIGADASSAHGVRVREFWKAYFARSGATLPESNYRLIATEGTRLGCA